MKNNSKKRKTNEEFIIDSRIVHGDLYDYSKCVYKNAFTNVIIICKKHGEFSCRPNNHLNGSICKRCSIEKSIKSNDEFINDVKRVHGNEKFSFDYTHYTHSMKNVVITCNEHGNFNITPNRLMSGRGCQKCSRQKLTNDEFIKKSIDVHGNLYDYSKSVYKNLNTGVVIICKRHGEFIQTPRDHIHSKSMCPSCSFGGYKRTKYGYFYIQEITNKNDLKVGYKFGITNKEPSRRLKQIQDVSIFKHKLVYVIGGDGDDIFKLEKYIKNNVERSYIQQCDMYSGYTETVQTNELDKILSCVSNYGCKYELLKNLL